MLNCAGWAGGLTPACHCQQPPVAAAAIACRRRVPVCRNPPWCALQLPSRSINSFRMQENRHVPCCRCECQLPCCGLLSSQMHGLMPRFQGQSKSKAQAGFQDQTSLPHTVRSVIVQGLPAAKSQACWPSRCPGCRALRRLPAAAAPTAETRGRRCQLRSWRRSAQHRPPWQVLLCIHQALSFEDCAPGAGPVKILLSVCSPCQEHPVLSRTYRPCTPCVGNPQPPAWGSPGTGQAPLWNASVGCMLLCTHTGMYCASASW